MTCRQSSGSISTTGRRSEPLLAPALLTRTSIRPNRSRTWSTRSRTCCRSRTSDTAHKASRPAARTSSATDSMSRANPCLLVGRIRLRVPSSASEHHVAAGVRERYCDGASDRSHASGACHDRDLASESSESCSHRSSLVKSMLYETSRPSPYPSFVACERWRNTTLNAWPSARRAPRSRRGLLDEAAAIAAGLSGLGVHEGDFVTIALPNTVDWFVVYVATWMLGAVPQPISACLPTGKSPPFLSSPSRG